MPSVNLSPETYERLKRLAATRSSSVDSAAEEAVRSHVDAAILKWAERLERIAAKPEETLDREDLEFLESIRRDAAQAQERARRLSPSERMKEWRDLLAEVRSTLDLTASEDEVNRDVDAALAEVRAGRRARGR